MTFLAVAWKPQAPVSKDLKLGMQMTPLPPPAEAVEALVPPTCSPIWAAWRVIWNMSAPSVPIDIKVGPSALDPIPYPAGCWSYLIQWVGEPCDGDCLEWTADFRDADDNPIDAKYVNLLDPGGANDVQNCQGINLSVTDWFVSDQIDLTGSTLVLTALLRGVQFGPELRFACAPTKYPTVWNHWLPQKIDFSVPETVPDPDQTYEQFHTNDIVHIFGFTLNEWWTTTNLSRFTFVITQDAGTPVPNASYFQVIKWDCSNWGLFFIDGYDYSGTAFIIQPQLDGVDFGDSLYYLCEV